MLDGRSACGGIFTAGDTQVIKVSCFRPGLLDSLSKFVVIYHNASTVAPLLTDNITQATSPIIPITRNTQPLHTTMDRNKNTAFPIEGSVASCRLAYKWLKQSAVASLKGKGVELRAAFGMTDVMYCPPDESQD